MSEGCQVEIVDSLLALLLRMLAADGWTRDDVTPETNLLMDLGVDSLLLVEFLLRVETELGIPVDFGSLNYQDLASLRRLADVLAARMETAPDASD